MIRFYWSFAKTELQFLSSSPRFANMMSPNLILSKLRLVGIPSIIGYIYDLFFVPLGFAGFVGVKKYGWADA